MLMLTHPASDDLRFLSQHNTGRLARDHYFGQMLRQRFWLKISIVTTTMPGGELVCYFSIEATTTVVHLMLPSQIPILEMLPLPGPSEI